MNDVTLIGMLASSPTAAFAELRERPRFVLPLLLVIAASLISTIWYFSLVDVAWLADQMISANERLANMPPDTRDRIVSSMTRNGMLISAAVSICVVIPAMYALVSVYYLLAGKIVGASLSFKHWFTMAAWCGLPSLLGLLAGIVVLLVESSPLQISQMEMQVFSLNELIFHIPPTGRGATLLGTISLIQPISWLLATICVHTWTKRSWFASATFVLLPSVVVYGGWAIYAFR